MRVDRTAFEGVDMKELANQAAFRRFSDAVNSGDVELLFGND